MKQYTYDLSYDTYVPNQVSLTADDKTVYGDAGYLGIQKRPEIEDDELKSKIDFRSPVRCHLISGSLI